MIHISQLLCPARHCLLACAWDEHTSNPHDAEIQIRDLAKAMQMNPWCRICGSTEFHVEHGCTKYQTMAEAASHINATAAANAASRIVLDALGQTHDKKRNN